MEVMEICSSPGKFYKLLQRAVALTIPGKQQSVSVFPTSRNPICRGSYRLDKALTEVNNNFESCYKKDPGQKKTMDRSEKKNTIPSASRSGHGRSGIRSRMVVTQMPLVAFALTPAAKASPTSTGMTRRSGAKSQNPAAPGLMETRATASSMAKEPKALLQTYFEVPWILTSLVLPFHQKWFWDKETHMSFAWNITGSFIPCQLPG